MTSLSVAIAPDLLFEFRDIDECLLEHVAAFLDFYPIAEDPAGALVVSSDSPPVTHLDLERARVLLEEEDLLVRRSGRVALFESPSGTYAWCDSENGVAGLLAGSPSDGTRERFVWRVLAGLLMELAEPRGWFGLHAAGAVVEGQGLLLTGPSGVGKTTLVGRLNEAGHGVLSDDLIWLGPSSDGFEAIPFPRGAARATVPVPTVARTDLSAIICPTIIDTNHSSVAPLSTADVLSVLIEQSHFLGGEASSARRFKMLVQLARSLPGYRLEAGRRQQEIPPLLARLAAALA